MTSPPKIEQQVTFLRAADLEKTAAFYETILQLPLVLDQGACRIYETGPNAYLGFCEHFAAVSEHPEIIITLATADVDGWHAYLVAKGVPIEKPPTLNERFQIYQCFIRDPDGYLIEIQTFLDPSWPRPEAVNG